jgi:hypothetical protein
MNINRIIIYISKITDLKLCNLPGPSGRHHNHELATAGALLTGGRHDKLNKGTTSGVDSSGHRSAICTNPGDLQAALWRARVQDEAAIDRWWGRRSLLSLFFFLLKQ